jgi:hypothetical protein
LDLAFQAFATDQLMTVTQNEAKRLFDEMCGNTREYLRIIGNALSIYAGHFSYEL